MAGSTTTRGILEKTHLLSKFRGCLVGALVGDCIGAVFEMEDVVKKNELQSCIDKVCAANEGEEVKFDFTDDTAMTRSVCKSLIHCQRVDNFDLAKRFTEEFYKEPHRGYGASVGAVFSALRDSRYTVPHGPAQKQFDGRGSYGNGGAMRISPLALFAWNKDPATMQKYVEDITKITHSNKDAILGAQLQCAAVHYALHKSAPLVTSEFLSHLVSVMETLEAPTEQEKTEEPQNKRSKSDETTVKEQLTYSAKLKKIQEFMALEKIDDNEAVEILGNDVSALGSVATAVYSFVRAQQPMDHIPTTNNDNAFTRTIIHAISLGGDTDTIATMAGAMTGALYGLDSIPKNWQNKCEALQDALDFADALTDIVHS